MQRQKNSIASLRKRRATHHENGDDPAVARFKDPSATEMDQALEIVRFLRQVRDAGLRSDQLLERLRQPRNGKTKSSR
jgi:hypothetical protein